MAVIGGSHGGFLTGNLVGQHPDRFCCGVLRNPVMDISLMISVSDIPDWCSVEATGSKVILPACHLPAGPGVLPEQGQGGRSILILCCLWLMTVQGWTPAGQQSAHLYLGPSLLDGDCSLQEGMTVQPTPDQLARFHEVSPIAHVDKVQAPLLFMLGAKDRRYETTWEITRKAIQHTFTKISMDFPEKYGKL